MIHPVHPLSTTSSSLHLPSMSSPYLSSFSYLVYCFHYTTSTYNSFYTSSLLPHQSRHFLFSTSSPSPSSNPPPALYDIFSTHDIRTLSFLMVSSDSFSDCFSELFDCPPGGFRFSGFGGGRSFFFRFNR